jgi:ribosomal RNA-processing protein 9
VQASGAGDGVIRLWEVEGTAGAKGRQLAEIGGLPARGFVNALAIARSGQFVVAGVGQEPRLGRWARDVAAKNGLLVHGLKLSAA